MNTMQAQVMAYHESIGAPIADGPTAIDHIYAAVHVTDVTKAVRAWAEENNDAHAGDLTPAYDALIELVHTVLSIAVLTGFDIEPGFTVLHKERMADTSDEAGEAQALLRALVEQQIEDGQVYRLSNEIADRIRRDQPLTIPDGTNARIVGRAWAGAGVILAKSVSDIAAHNRWEGMQ
ncbi:MazG-like nucleotide pyrophosphohydrolase [Microbacterium phage Phinky]|nr:MazG-like nucleotide pyrophosphohydrolase [Microbacterium phage Phinky]